MKGPLWNTWLGGFLISDKITLLFPKRFLNILASPTPSCPRPPVMSTLGWSVSENETEWKLASDVTWRGEKLMFRRATVNGWHPHPGVRRACLATLLRVLTTGIVMVTYRRAGRERNGCVVALHSMRGITTPRGASARCSRYRTAFTSAHFIKVKA